MSRSTGLLTVGVVLAQEGAKSGAKAASGVAQALTDMENQWAKASKASDGDALAPLLAADFVMLDSDGSLHNKADVVARTKKATGAVGGHVGQDGSRQMAVRRVGSGADQVGALATGERRADDVNPRCGSKAVRSKSDRL